MNNELELNTAVDTDTVEETTELVLADVVTEIVTALQSDEITLYGIAKIVNTVFAAFEIDKTVRPQMMYNYGRNGLIVKGDKGRKQYTSEETIAFVNKYCGKHI